MFAEIATISWLVNYIEDNYKYNINRSAFYSVMFLIMFSIGRLIGGFVVEKFGYLNSDFIYFRISYMKENELIIISISGLFFAITFPTLILSVSKVFKQNNSYITGEIVTLTS